MGNWQSLLSTLVSTLISSSFLFYDALLLIDAQLPPTPTPGPTSCLAFRNYTACSSSRVHISFPFVTADHCNDTQSDFLISDCQPSSEHPHWPGFTREATTNTQLNWSAVMGMRPPSFPNSSQGYPQCYENYPQPLPSYPCHGYINLTWRLPLLRPINNNCNNLASLDNISHYIPGSINLQRFAHSAFTLDPSNIILLFDCNATGDNNLNRDTPACKSYVQQCKGSTSSCYQYTIPNPLKELLLPQVMRSADCKQAMFFVTSSPSRPFLTWQPGLIQLSWNSSHTLEQCASCTSANRSCGYDSLNNFQCSEDITPSPTTHSTASAHHHSNNLIIPIGVAASLAMALFMSFALLALVCFCKKKNACTKATPPCSTQLPWIKRPSFLSKQQDPFVAKEISYEELVHATDSFAEKNVLGDGGFGAVYKGVLANGLKVAVKRLHHHNYRRIDHFYNEIKVLSTLSHPNLVKLFAFCACEDEKELLLVFEYASQGTVSDHLHSGLKPQLSWSSRLNIACETAATLSYLHNAVNPPIYHRDVKTTNILLDDDLHVKLADFGLSKLVPLKATHITTAPQGTPGYLDPEYHECYQLTDKSDVYSLGVVLMELISAKLAVDMTRERGEINLSTLAVVKIQCGLTEELVDPALEMKQNPSVEKSIKRVVELAFACLQACRDDRPSMADVAEALVNIRREHEEGRLNTHIHPQDANSTPTQGPPPSPCSVFFSSDSSCPSSNFSST